MIVPVSSKKKTKITPWSRVLQEKLRGLQLVKFPTFDGT
jgi:hypothetical protein